MGNPVDVFRAFRQRCEAPPPLKPDAPSWVVARPMVLPAACWQAAEAIVGSPDTTSGVGLGASAGGIQLSWPLAGTDLTLFVLVRPDASLEITVDGEARFEPSPDMPSPDVPGYLRMVPDERLRVCVPAAGERGTP